MKIINRMTTAILLTWTLGLANADQGEPLTAKSPCTRVESWAFSKGIRKNSKQVFQDFLSHKIPTIVGFSEALAFRRQSRTDALKLFGEYWISRSLFEMGMIHAAQRGFDLILSRMPQEDLIGIQLAALGCLNRIQHKYPTLISDHNQIFQLDRLNAFAPSHPSLTEAAINFFANHPDDILEVQKILSTQPQLGSFVNGMSWAKKGNAKLAVHALERVLLKDGSLPQELLRYSDSIHLTLARMNFKLKEWNKSVAHLKKVSKRSNDFAETLSELAWSHLMADQLREAIGAATSLNSGGFKRTFTPESPMVMAMALNELCQFPRSLAAINTFRKNYEEEFKWLNQWKKQTSQPLYPLAIQYLKNQPVVPDRLGSEWVKTAFFLSHQSEINLLFSERASSEKISQSGEVEENRVASSIHQLATKLNQFYKKRKELKQNSPLPKKIKEDLNELRRQLIRHRRIREAAPVWQAVHRSHQQRAIQKEAALVKAINRDLIERNHRMLQQLNEIAENNQLIEVEIFNGASRDIVWQNANPDYKKIADQMKNDNEGMKRSQVWEWGKTDTETDTEIWEDELDSLKADLVDHCSSKDKYLAIRY